MITTINNFKNTLNESNNMIDIIKDFKGVKIYTKDVELKNKISKLAKQHNMFLLATYSGVRWYISESIDNNDLDTFKSALNTL